MRSIQRLRKADFNKIQSTMRQKKQKQLSTLISFMQLPDCDVTEFFQQLMKNQNYVEMLEEIPEQKKIDFFAKNYNNFLETQEELLSLKVPQLSQIPKAKQFHLKIKQDVKNQQDGDQAAVIEIIDSFSTHVLEKNNEEAMRIYKIILEMKQHSRYKQHFYSYSINKIFREAYTSFVQNCQDVEILLKLHETVYGIKIYFEEKETKMFEKITGDLKIDSSVGSLKKTLSYLLNQIQEYSHEFKAKFMKQLEKQPQLAVYLSKWINDMALSYYQCIQPLIYEQQQISDILKNLGEILQTSKETQSKGISLHRELRNHISADLPHHLQKIIQVLLDSFDDLLKYNNDLYEFIEVKSLNSIPQLIEMLNPITKKDYGKKCCSKKGILLINSFLVILLPLCDEKWSFLHQNILQAIVDKVKAMLQQQKIKLPMWDYYHLFMFFYQLGQGKVRHRVLFDPSNSSYLRDKISKIKRLADECRSVFENSLLQSLWTQILSSIPQLLWQFRKYAESQQKSSLKPTVFSISLIFSLQEFFKQLEFRLSKEHYDYLGIQFYEYIIYIIQYILFWSYHERGQNTKVFTLYKKQQKLLNRARQTFPIQQLPNIKNKQILKLSYFTKYGLERFIIDLYFLSDVFKILLNRCEKIKADQFTYKISRILAKELKSDPLQTDRKQYGELLKQFLNVYQNQPEVIKKYLNERRAVSVSKSQKAVLNSSSQSKQRKYIQED